MNETHPKQFQLETENELILQTKIIYKTHEWQNKKRKKNHTHTGHTETYSEICQTSEMERFAKIVNNLHSLTILIKRCTFDV